LEIVVVVDGPDPDTKAVLDRYSSRAVRCVVNPQSLGAARARQAGVEAARGAWIAILDDDDEWLPEKLEQQMGLLLASNSAWPVGICQVVARSESFEDIWPKRGPAPLEPLSEYLFNAGGIRDRSGHISSSMLVAPRELMLRLPFDETAPNDDTDWCLRAVHVEGAEIVYCPRALSIYNVEESRERMITRIPWQKFAAWGRAHPELLTKRAYAGWMLVFVAGRARRRRDWRGMWQLWWDAWRHGKPGRYDVALFALYFVPPRAMDMARALYRRVISHRTLLVSVKRRAAEFPAKSKRTP
jgi:glycosyltransferase involved in cell wall biosynthesis